MKARLTINLDSLPEEGQNLSLDLDPAFFELPEADGSPAGPVQVDMRAQRFESELLLTGRADAPFRFTCVGCLRDFIQTISLQGAAIAHEIETGGEIDLTEALREEFLIEFPAHPRCYEGDEEYECKIDPRYLAVDKAGEDDVKTPPTPADDDRWSALDGLSESLSGPSE